jgi:hypothetical protein
MVAPVVVAAGIAARYGAKKLMKHLTTKSARKVAKKQAKEAKIAGKAGTPTKAQMKSFTKKLNRQESNMADDNFGNIINTGPTRTQLKKQSKRLIKKQIKQVEKKYNRPYGK